MDAKQIADRLRKANRAFNRIRRDTVDEAIAYVTSDFFATEIGKEYDEIGNAIDAAADLLDRMRAESARLVEKICACPQSCDCESPDDGLCSQECPEHNITPRPSPTCPVHGETQQDVKAYAYDSIAEILEPHMDRGNRCGFLPTSVTEAVETLVERHISLTAENARLVDEVFALYSLIQQAQKFGIGSFLSPMCNCLTKTPDPAFHQSTCPVSIGRKIARAALEASDE